jgi:hypothetical protein
MRTSTSATHVCCRTVSPCNRNECRTCQVQPLPQPCCSRILLERTVREKRAWIASPALCLLALSEIPCMNAPSFVLDSSLYTWCRVGGCGPTLGAPLLGAQVNLPPTRHLKWSWSKSPAIRAFRSVLFGVVPWLPTRSLRRGSQPELLSWLPTRAHFEDANPSSFLGCEPEFVLPLASGPPSLPPIALACCVKCRSVWALLRGVCGRLANAPLLQHLSVSNGPRVRPVSCQRATAPHSRACHAPKCCVGVFGGSAPRPGPRTPLIVPSLGSFPSSLSLLAADHRFAQPGAQASLLGGSARLPCKRGCRAENVAVTLCVKATLFR